MPRRLFSRSLEHPVRALMAGTGQTPAYGAAAPLRAGELAAGAGTDRAGEIAATAAAARVGVAGAGDARLAVAGVGMLQLAVPNQFDPTRFLRPQRIGGGAGLPETGSRRNHQRTTNHSLFFHDISPLQCPA